MAAEDTRLAARLPRSSSSTSDELLSRRDSVFECPNVKRLVALNSSTARTQPKLIEQLTALLDIHADAIPTRHSSTPLPTELLLTYTTPRESVSRRRSVEPRPR
jgi:hypothetical protein